MKSAALVVAVTVGSWICATAQTEHAEFAPQAKDSLPLSAKSTKVLKLVDQAWVLDSDRGELKKSIEVMRRVVKMDPKFAMGHEILAQISLDPAEQVKEQALASATKRNATAAEQTVIDWFQNAADHKLIPAITSMNEVLAQYPHDRWLVFLANSWLMQQMQYKRGAEVYEASGIKNSPGLMNNVAYTYAHMRQFKKAFALMEQYVKLMPHEANPNDSYAELLRMAGQYEAAVEHYRAALAINPQFYTSAYGIADTYLLMGEEVRAREEYKKAFEKFPSVPEGEYVQWKTREATTYLYENDIANANKAFESLAEYAHSKHMSQVEADTYRQMALYQTRSDKARQLLRKAEAALAEGKSVSPAGIHQEMAQILRARVEVAIKIGDTRSVATAVARLSDLSNKYGDDRIIESSYQGAEGARLFQAQRYKEAIAHLEEDADNPLSLNRVAVAYRRSGYISGAKRTEETLANFNDPTVEQALIVPAFRKCLQQRNCDLAVKNAALTR